MATILRASDASCGSTHVAMNLDDLVVQANEYLADVKAEADELIDAARREADAIRQRAAEEGQQAALQAVDQLIARQIAPALDAVRRAADELRGTRQTWLSHWERAAARLATAIAARIIRREVRQQPDITLTLVREALELAAGSSGVRLHLNPADYKLLGAEVRSLIDATSSLAKAEVMSDPGVTAGGCRVDTCFGTIDQQFETQLARIEEELTS